jgi:hypothetical protein
MIAAQIWIQIGRKKLGLDLFRAKKSVRVGRPTRTDFLPGTDLVQKRGHVFDLDSLNLGKKKRKNKLRQAAIANKKIHPLFHLAHPTYPTIC